jgi:5'-3' exonuclease
VGLQWNMKYYFDKCADWYWFYHHDATPLLTDFFHYIEINKEQINQVSFVNDQPIKPYHQLMMILPPQSANLLPLPFRSYMLSDYSPLIHYYPVDFELDYYGKQFRWETHPKIPFMNPQELPQYLDHLEMQLTNDEYLRGQIGKPHVFIP